MDDLVRVLSDESSALRSCLETVLNLLPDPIIVADPSGRIVFGNTAADEKLGSGVVGRTTAELAERLGVTTLEGVITEAEQLRRELARASADLRARNESLVARERERMAAATKKSDFLAMLSHELRTPLNAVIGFSELLIAGSFGPVSPEQRRVLQDIHSAGDQQVVLLNDVLDLSKIEAGTMELRLERVQLATPLAQALKLLERAAEKKKLSIADHLSSCSFAVAGDTDRLRQVLLSLISNAIKVTPEGGSIDVGATLEGDKVRVTVSDTGIGVPPEDAERLFRPFPRADSGSRRRIGGTGLGLAISKLLVELMGGEIGMTSEPQHGSRSWFTIPRATERTPERSVRRSSPSAPIPPDSLAQRKVLIVDDNELNRRVVRTMLSGAGCEVIESTDGADGIQRAERDRPEVILMDLEMPGTGGIEATRELKRRSATAHIPVIALTAHTMVGHREQALTAGCVAFVGKPVARAELIGAIERALAKASRSGSTG